MSAPGLTDWQNNCFEILAPAQWVVPLVVNSPHSGTGLPAHFCTQSSLSTRQLRASEDCFVDQLFEGCLEHGAPMMRATLSRSFLDLNREPYELDPRMFVDRLPNHANIASPRVACGLGTLPRTVGEGLLIYNDLLPVSEAVERIEKVYRPYHRALAALLSEAHTSTGTVLLIDAHSMPSGATHGLRHGFNKTADIVLGDRFGSSCCAEVAEAVETHFQAQGLQVARNKPYSGGFFTESHGRPRFGRHALQIEINRALYMDESTQTTHAGFAQLKTCVDGLWPTIASALEPLCQPSQAAAAE